MSGAAKDAAAGARALAALAPRARWRRSRWWSRCTPITARRQHVDAFLRPLLAASRERVARGERAAVSLAHVRRLDAAARGEPARSPPSCWSGAASSASCSRSSAAWSAARRTASAATSRPRAAVHDAGGSAAGGRGARHRRARPLPGGGDVRQRPRRSTRRATCSCAQRSWATARTRSRRAYPGARFQYVFHGSSGSSPAELREAVAYGVVKVNLDTDAQYAFTRAIAGHVFTHYDGVLRGGRRDRATSAPTTRGRGAPRPRPRWRARVAAGVRAARLGRAQHRGLIRPSRRRRRTPA